MQSLLKQIAESLTEWAWGGSRIDEATHLVQSYCYSKLPTRSVKFSHKIDDAICFAPTIQRIFLRLWTGTFVELTEDLLFVQEFETGDTSGRIAFNPVSRRLVTNGLVGGPSSALQYLPTGTIGFAIDATTGDMFLASRADDAITKNQLKVTHVNSRLDELAGFFIAGHRDKLYGLFCDGGFLVVDHADDRCCVSVYDTTTRRKLHHFHTDRTVVHLDGHRRRIFLFGGGSYAVDFDGNRIPDVPVKCCNDRLSNDLLVAAQFCDHQYVLRLVEPL